MILLRLLSKKLREERDMALDAEHQAMVRASLFEMDRDRIQRRFKVCASYTCFTLFVE